LIGVHFSFTYPWLATAVQYRPGVASVVAEGRDVP